MKVEVTRYRKPDGWPTRYWAVIVDGDLLAVTVYRKDAEAVARAINPIPKFCHIQNHAPSENKGSGHHNSTTGLATHKSR